MDVLGSGGWLLYAMMDVERGIGDALGRSCVWMEVRGVRVEARGDVAGGGGREGVEACRAFWV